MSYIVEILRPIRKEELLAIVGSDSELAVLEEGDGWVDVRWARGDDRAVFTLAQGRISVTTPGDGAWEKAQAFARHLNAAVIGEEDEIPLRKEIKRGVFAGRSTWIGWPILVLVLLAMLIWKW